MVEYGIDFVLCSNGIGFTITNRDLNAQVTHSASGKIRLHFNFVIILCYHETR